MVGRREPSPGLLRRVETFARAVLPAFGAALTMAAAAGPTGLPALVPAVALPQVVFWSTFRPGAMSLHNMMSGHGPDVASWQGASEARLEPHKTEGTMAFMIESRWVFHCTDYALETSALDTNEKIIGCTLSKLAGAAFVKTSTGFGKGGATVEDVQLMRSIVGGELGVKASGGVRTVEDAIKMAQAGANRIGASASVAIVTGKTDAKAKGY